MAFIKEENGKLVIEGTPEELAAVEQLTDDELGEASGGVAIQERINEDIELGYEVKHVVVGSVREVGGYLQCDRCGGRQMKISNINTNGVGRRILAICYGCGASALLEVTE